MSNTTVLQLNVPSELYQKVRNISVSFGTDFDTDLVSLLECYVSSFERLLPREVCAVVEDL